MRDTAGELGTNSQVTYSRGPPHMDEQKQDDQLEHIYNSAMPRQEIALKSNWKQWTIEKGGGRGSGRSVLMSRHDDDEARTVSGRVKTFGSNRHYKQNELYF